jgi:hypothetical protein
MGDVRLVAVLLLTTLVAGCADDAQPASGSSSSPTPHATSTPEGATTKAAVCTPRPRVTVRKRVPTVLYALRFTVAPGRRKQGEQDATLYTYPEIAPGVFVTQPRHDVPDRSLIDAVLAKVPQGSPVLDGSRGLAWDVRNTTATRGRYLAYGGAVVYRGDWSATTCGARHERLSGSVVVIGRVRAGVVRCHDRATADRLRRAAALTACHHDPASARPFRMPSG